MFRFLLPLLALLLSACTTSRIETRIALPADAKVALLPIANNAQTPLAGENAENMLASLWYQDKLPPLLRYPQTSSSQQLPVFDNHARLAQARQWLSHQQVDYVLRGSIEEWRYKAGLDGEPVVAITLNLYRQGETTPVWSGTATRTGWGRDSLAATALTVLERLLAQIGVRQ
jgi:hypothetical protein